MEFRVDGGEFTTGSSIMPQKKNPDIAKLIRGRTGTELADYLVRKGMPFRKAHAIVGKIVNDCVSKKITLRQYSLKEYQRYSKIFGNDVYKVLDVRVSIRMKRSAGSTSPVEVAKALRVWRRKLPAKT